MRTSGDREAAPADGAARPGLLVTVVPSLAQFLVVADTTIVSVAMPSIRDDLGLSGAEQEWVVNAYLLVFGGLLIFGGRCGDVLGRRRVFLGSLGLLAVASLAGGLASEPVTLIAARALQGLAAALLTPAPLALIAGSHPDPAARMRAIAIWSAIASSGLGAGTILGGVLAGAVGWRWILFINVPAAVLLAAVAYLRLPRDRVRGSRREIDLTGGVLGAVGVGALVYAFSSAQRYTWTSLPVAGSLAIATAVLVAFVVVESRVARPLVELTLFRLSGVATGNLAMVLIGAILAPVVFALSVLFHQVRGYNAAGAALAILPMTVVIPLVSVQAPRVLRAIGPRRYLFVSALVTVAGLIWQARLTPHGPYLTDVLVPGILIGAGMGGTGPAVSAAAMAVPEKQAGTASALLNASRQIGGSVGVAVLANVAIGRVNAASGPVETARAYATALLVVSP